MEVFSTKVDASQVDLSIVLNPDTSDTVSKPTKRAKTPTTTPGTMTVPHASNIWHTEIAVGPPIGNFQPTESLHRRGKQYVQITPNSVVRYHDDTNAAHEIYIVSVGTYKTSDLYQRVLLVRRRPLCNSFDLHTCSWVVNGPWEDIVKVGATVSNPHQHMHVHTQVLSFHAHTH